METISIIIICLNLLASFIIVYGQHKTSKDNLLLTLKIGGIVLLFFMPILILMLALFYQEDTNFMEELTTHGVLIISILLLLCLPIITLIQYLIKRKKESQEVNKYTKAEVELNQHKKRLKKIMIPACILPILVTAGLLIFDKSIRCSAIGLSLFISIICVEFILLIWFMRKLR